jgi:hypothetical protein
MLAIANKYAMAEEVTLDNREAKKDKKSSHPTNLERRKPMTRRGSTTTMSPMCSGHTAT